jgi:hypothetical protein
MEKMTIWNAGYKVPKDAQKDFNNGRFKGSSIEPTWRYRVLTELFGACGMGWRFVQVNSCYSPSGNAHYCTGYIEYVTEGTLADPEARVHRTSTLTGGTPVYDKGQDETPKMSETDCISKICHHMGIAGEVYAGKFDGDKYQMPTGEPAQKSYSAPPASKPSEAKKHTENKDIGDVICELDPGGVVFHFGKYKGATVEEMASDPKGKSYLDWYVGRCKEQPPTSQQDSILYRAVLQYLEGPPTDGVTGDADVDLEGFF